MGRLADLLDSYARNVELMIRVDGRAVANFNNIPCGWQRTGGALPRLAGPCPGTPSALFDLAGNP
jgi:hypothetical protein